MKANKYILNSAILTLVILIGVTKTYSQDISEQYRNKLTPVTPIQYQFQKFGEIPINEYTGSPTIEIPLIDVKTKGYQFPVKLQYFSKGIRVSEESDWVGLGWDLSFASISQNVYGYDDFSFTTKIKKKLPYVCCSVFGIHTYSQTTPNFTTMNQ